MTEVAIVNRPNKRGLQNSVDALEKWMSGKVDNFRFLEGTVTSVTDGRVSILRDTDEIDPDEEEYYQIAGLELQVGDPVICFRMGEDMIVLGRKQVVAATYKYLATTLRMQGGKGFMFEGSTPSATPAAAAGTGATLTVVGSNVCGRITLVTGSASVAAGLLGTISFSPVLTSSDYTVVLGPCDSDAAIAQAWSEYNDRLTTSFTIRVPGVLPLNRSHVWFYRIDQYIP